MRRIDSILSNWQAFEALVKSGVVPFQYLMHVHAYLKLDSLRRVGHRAYCKTVASEYKCTRQNIQRIVRIMEEQI